MNTLDKIINKISELPSSDIVSLIGSLSQALAAIIVGVISLYIFRRTLKLKSSKYLLSNIYLPVFNIIEPFLYKDINLNTLYSLMKSIEKALNNVTFIPPILKSQLENLHNDLNNDHFNHKNFNRFCYHIDEYYTKHCKNSFLPLRSTQYKLQRKQYQTKCDYVFSLLGYALKTIACLTILIFFSAILILWSLLILIISH